VTAARRKAEDELLTLTQAARRCDVSRSRLRRALDDGSLPNAVQSDDDRGTWLVPVSDLVDAGLLADPDSSRSVREQSADSSRSVREQVLDSSRSVQDDPGEQSTVSAEQVAPGVGLIPWEGVQSLVTQLVTAQDDRARTETELRVVQFRLEQAEAELQRLRAAQAARAEAAQAALAEAEQVARAQQPAPATDPGKRSTWPRWTRSG
jgi:hypothetical protein